MAETGGPEIALPDDEGLRFIIGPPLRDSFAHFAGARRKERLMEFYRERYGPLGAFENRVYDGVVAALDGSPREGARLYRRDVEERDRRAARSSNISGSRHGSTRSTARGADGVARRPSAS